MAGWLVDGYLLRNLGDDLMIRELCEARPNTKHVSPDLRPDTAKPFCDIANLSAADISWWGAGLSADGYTMCGGSMFIDRPQDWRSRARFVARWFRRVAVAACLRLRGKDVEVIGCNIGPVETLWGKVLFRGFLRLATRVTVRDSVSSALAAEWGLRGVVQAPDMVLSYLARTMGHRDRPVVNGRVGISVMEWPGVPRAHCVQEYAQLVALLLEQPEVTEVVLLGLQDRLVRDDQLAEEIITEFSGSASVVDGSYHGSVPDFLACLASCERVVATRFHSGILALGLGIPMIQLAYSRKISDYLSSVGWVGAAWEPRVHLVADHGPEMVRALLEAEPSTHLPPEAALHAWVEI